MNTDQQSLAETRGKLVVCLTMLDSVVMEMHDSSMDGTPQMRLALQVTLLAQVVKDILVALSDKEEEL